MDFQNSSLWQLGYIQNFTGQVIGLETMRIPSFFTGNFDSNIIKIKLTSSTALPTRNRAAYLDHCVTLDNGEVNIIDTYSLYLRDSKIFNLRDFTPYFLRFTPDRDIRQLTVSVYKFTGIASNPSSPFILSL